MIGPQQRSTFRFFLFSLMTRRPPRPTQPTTLFPYTTLFRSMMGLAVGTVRKYAYAESFPVPETRPLRPSILDPHLARLEARLAEGCENGLALWRELRAAGFPGTAKQVHRWLAERRTAPARTT